MRRCYRGGKTLVHHHQGFFFFPPPTICFTASPTFLSRKTTHEPRNALLHVMSQMNMKVRHKNDMSNYSEKKGEIQRCILSAGVHNVMCSIHHSSISNSLAGFFFLPAHDQLQQQRQPAPSTALSLTVTGHTGFS